MMPVSGPTGRVTVSGMPPMAVSGAGRRLDVGRRRVVVVRRVVVPPDDAREVVLRVVALRRVVVAAFLVRGAARLVVLVARCRVVAARELVPRAICLACLVRSSIRFRTLLTSARVLARLTWVCSVLIAARAVLSASFILRSTWRRRSGGTRLSASLTARRPALTARPTRPDRRDVRFLFAIITSTKMPARNV